MADIKTSVVRNFIGRAWVNKIEKEGPNKGKSFINVKLDQGIDEVTLKKGDTLQLWPNAKREGKKDADLRLSIVNAA